jgi:hypothetical protein
MRNQLLIQEVKRAGARILTRQNQICSLPCYADLRRGTFHLWVGPGQSYFEIAEGKLVKLDKLVLVE